MTYVNEAAVQLEDRQRAPRGVEMFLSFPWATAYEWSITCRLMRSPHESKSSYSTDAHRVAPSSSANSDQIIVSRGRIVEAEVG
jgi:hypothetical protein